MGDIIGTIVFIAIVGSFGFGVMYAAIRCMVG
jgi:hypothetical protein